MFEPTSIRKQNLTIRGSFENSRIAFETKKKGTVALWGSITEMNGYRPMLMDFLEKRFPQTEFSFINAGISSTCSTTGAFRLQRDVLSHGPVDLFFLEFAVNDDQDAAHSYDACIRGMEGIIRQMRKVNPRADIVYYFRPGMLAEPRKAKPRCLWQHTRRCLRNIKFQGYLARELAHQINHGKFTWEKFADTSQKLGNRLCADMHQKLLSLVGAALT